MWEGNVSIINSICLRSELEKKQSKKLNDLIEKFKTLTGPILGKTNKIFYKIDTGEVKSIRQRHHVMSLYKLEILNRELDRMLELGIVRKSDRPWASPVLIVEKANGESRLSFDE